MTRRYISLIASDPARRVVGGPNVLVSFYNGRTSTLATAYLALTGSDVITLPMQANAGVEHFVRIQPATGDTTIEVDSTTGWLVGDVVRFRSGSTQTERAIKTIVDADTVILDAAIGFAFPIGTAIRGQVGHARVAVDDTQDYSADVQNVGEGWRSVRIDFAVLQTTGTVAFQKDDTSVGTEGTIDVRQMFDVVDDPGSVRVRFEFRDYVTETDGATIAVNFANGAMRKVILGGNRILTFAGGKAGGKYILKITQDGTGGRTITSWPAAVRFPGGVTPTLTTGAGKSDYFGFLYDGTNYDCVAITLNV